MNLQSRFQLKCMSTIAVVVTVLFCWSTTFAQEACAGAYGTETVIGETLKISWNGTLGDISSETMEKSSSMVNLLINRQDTSKQKKMTYFSLLWYLTQDESRWYKYGLCLFW